MDVQLPGGRDPSNRNRMETNMLLWGLVAKQIRRWQAYRRTMLELSQLDDRTLADIIKRADKALYASKEAGRNRTTIDVQLEPAA